MEKNAARDYKKIAREIEEGLREYARTSGRRTAVIGLSGGVDSAVVAYLAVRALGRKNVILVLMPSRATKKSDLEDAKNMAKLLRVKTLFFDLAHVEGTFAKALAFKGIKRSGRKERGNLTARMRMAALYDIASRTNGLVVGTGDKSEISIGYFTKYGDGGCDVLPIGELYKTQVRKLAEELGIPGRIARKPSSPNLWKNHTAEGELGLGYERVDRILWLVERGMNENEIVARGIKKKEIEKIKEMAGSTCHKRALPHVIRVSEGSG